MKVLGLNWVGTRTEAFEETVAFFHSVLELPIGVERAHFVRLDLPNAAAVEVFDAASGEYPHFVTGPVPGFLVADFDSAREELATAGSELLGPEGGERGVYRWQHFRGPDSNVYEISEFPNRPAPLPPFGRLRVSSLIWVGTSTSAYPATARFFRETLQLRAVEESEDLIECQLVDGSAIEAFRRGGAMDHPYFRTGPVPGFGVVDIDEAVRLLQEKGVPLIAVRRRDWGGWAHFRAPDGCIYELKGPAPNPSAGDGNSSFAKELRSGLTH
jgi:catechol 2,3-dioxygenase-like lactoylglutathione lyase family enzyme